MKMYQSISKEETMALTNKKAIENNDAIKITFIVFIFLYGIFAITDRYFFPEQYLTLWVLRFGVVIPMFLFTLYLAYTNRLSKVYQPVVSFNFTLGGLIIAYMLVLSPTNMVYYGGLFMIYFSGYFLINLRFIYATVSGGVILIFHVLGTALVHQELPEEFLFGILFFLGANMIGMIGSKSLEILHVKQFIKDKEIEIINKELTKQNIAKNAQLEELLLFINENKTLKQMYTEKETLSIELQKSQKRFDQIAHQSRTFYYEIDMSGKYKYVSPSIQDILGYSPEEVIDTMYFYDFFPNEYKDEYTSVAFDCIEKEVILENLSNPLLTKKGDIIWVNSNIFPIYNEEGTAIAYQGSDMDFTKERETKQALEIFRSISEQAEYGAVFANLQGYMEYANDAFCTLHGLKRDEVINKHISILHTEAQMVHVNQLLNTLSEKGGFKSEEVWHKRKDGSVFPTIMSGKMIYENEEPKYLSATLIDITEQHATQEELLESEKRYRIVSEVSNTGVWEYNITNNYLWCSQEYFSMLGLDKNDYEMEPDNLTQTWVDLIHPDDLEQATTKFNLYLKDKTASGYENHYRMLTNKGGYRWIWSRGNFVRDKDNNPTDNIIGTHIDVNDEKEKESEIIYVSNHDYLTNIPNRRYFQEMLIRYDAINYYPLGTVLIDLNGLKIINDAFGHDAGNEALIKVAKALSSNVREGDSVARIGGDEFAILCPNVETQELDELLQRVSQTISNETVKDIHLSIAIGFEIKNDSQTKISKILTEAENKMYKNKALSSLSTRNNAIRSILLTLQNKYNEEKVHSERVSRFCGQIAKAMGLRNDEVKELEMAGLYHDIGKISIPDNILHKPGQLSEEEWVIMRNHTINGYQILRAADRYSNIAEYAMSHHERMDGKGYPNGIKGEDIPLFSRIICVADAYEAMTSDRPYRKALKKKEAIDELISCAGTQFDKGIVNTFVHKVLIKH